MDITPCGILREKTEIYNESMNEYQSFENFNNDPRFYVDEFNTNRILTNAHGVGYSVVFVPVGSILRELEGKITSLYDTHVYPYLLGTDDGRQKYSYYCNTYPSSFRNETNYLKLLEDMKAQEYDIKKGAIVIEEHNFILDGQHRACITLYKYGPFYKVQVVKCFFGTHYGKKRRIKYEYYKFLAGMRCIGEYVKYRMRNKRILL